jgi:hypothetical protein
MIGTIMPVCVSGASRFCREVKSFSLREASAIPKENLFDGTAQLNKEEKLFVVLQQLQSIY